MTCSLTCPNGDFIMVSTRPKVLTLLFVLMDGVRSIKATLHNGVHPGRVFYQLWQSTAHGGDLADLQGMKMIDFPSEATKRVTTIRFLKVNMGDSAAQWVQSKSRYYTSLHAIRASSPHTVLFEQHTTERLNNASRTHLDSLKEWSENRTFSDEKLSGWNCAFSKQSVWSSE